MKKRGTSLRGWEWLLGLAFGAFGGATWGWLGNSYEPGDSAIGTGLLGAVAGMAIGVVVTAVRQFKPDGEDPGDE